LKELAIVPELASGMVVMLVEEGQVVVLDMEL
jgi:hypothetical protein